MNEEIFLLRSAILDREGDEKKTQRLVDEAATAASKALAMQQRVELENDWQDYYFHYFFGPFETTSRISKFDSRQYVVRISCSKTS